MPTIASVTPDEASEKLGAFLQREHAAKKVRVENMRLLTGGASRQTWSFDATVEHADGRSETLALVARADPRVGVNTMSRETEYRVLQAAYDAGVPVPRMHLLGDDSLGVPFFLMDHVEGETIARRILRDDQYAEGRKVMASQLGEIAAAIHRVPLDTPGLAKLPQTELGLTPAETELARIEATYRSITLDPHPAYELAFRWLKRNVPPQSDLTLVHGDYRMGNLIVGPEGVRSVLDWELAHIGDPMEDFGFLCVRSWRFGNDHLPVGGVGQREELYAAYERAGGRKVDPQVQRWWEILGNLRWGIICIMQARAYLDGLSKSVELATIGRRTAETEWELMELLGAGSEQG
ncbi:MAG: phosphotransferase family protein [Chloroflexota bacterium]